MALDNDATKYDSKSMLFLCMSVNSCPWSSVRDVQCYNTFHFHCFEAKESIKTGIFQPKFQNTEHTHTYYIYRLDTRTHQLVESKYETSALKIDFTVVCLFHLPYPEIHLRSLYHQEHGILFIYYFSSVFYLFKWFGARISSMPINYLQYCQ